MNRAVRHLRFGPIAKINSIDRMADGDINKVTAFWRERLDHVCRNDFANGVDSRWKPGQPVATGFVFWSRRIIGHGYRRRFSRIELPVVVQINVNRDARQPGFGGCITFAEGAEAIEEFRAVD